MKKFIIIAFIISAIASSNTLFAQSSISSMGDGYSRNGNTFSSITKSKQEPELTSYTWKDSKGNEYPIYISSKGSCFYYKENGNKQYLKKEISIEICNELGREYKNKKK